MTNETVKLSEIDRLRLEVLQLKLASLEQSHAALVGQRSALTAEFAKTYSIPDGEFSIDTNTGAITY